MKIVGIGGGTGLPVLLRGLTEISDRHDPLDLTAIVTVSDSGGSTGVLRRAFNMPAMGDIRKCLISLAGDDSVLSSLYEHRFDNPENLAGHSVGNLILTTLYQMSGNFAAAVRQASDFLRLNGRVLPATEVPVTLCALYENGMIAQGERGVEYVQVRSGDVGFITFQPRVQVPFGPRAYRRIQQIGYCHQDCHKPNDPHPQPRC